jgi:serine phosphatase RsbU (regulator of sigma subunit)
LAPGDTLLAYTDGATEIFDGETNQLGTDGLVKMAQSQMSAATTTSLDLDALVEKLLAYSRQIHLDDDLTLLKMRRLA